MTAAMKSISSSKELTPFHDLVVAFDLPHSTIATHKAAQTRFGFFISSTPNQFGLIEITSDKLSPVEDFNPSLFTMKIRVVTDLELDDLNHKIGHFDKISIDGMQRHQEVHNNTLKKVL